MRLKYIRFHNIEMVIFPTTMQHDIMAKRLGLSKDDIQGAGFVDIEDIKMYGESESLGIKSHEDDLFHLKAFTS
jgi:hypothetical protein